MPAAVLADSAGLECTVMHRSERSLMICLGGADGGRPGEKVSGKAVAMLRSGGLRSD